MAEHSPSSDFLKGEDSKNKKEDAFKTGSPTGHDKQTKGGQGDLPARQHAQCSVSPDDDTGGQDPGHQNIPPPRPPPPILPRQNSSGDGSTGTQDYGHGDGILKGKPPVQKPKKNSTGIGSTDTQGDGPGHSHQGQPHSGSSAGQNSSNDGDPVQDSKACAPPQTGVNAPEEGMERDSKSSVGNSRQKLNVNVLPNKVVMKHPSDMQKIQQNMAAGKDKPKNLAGSSALEPVQDSKGCATPQTGVTPHEQDVKPTGRESFANRAESSASQPVVKLTGREPAKQPQSSASQPDVKPTGRESSANRAESSESQPGAFVAETIKQLANKNVKPGKSGTASRQNSLPTSNTKYQSKGSHEGQEEDSLEVIKPSEPQTPDVQGEIDPSGIELLGEEVDSTFPEYANKPVTNTDESDLINCFGKMSVTEKQIKQDTDNTKEAGVQNDNIPDSGNISEPNVGVHIANTDVNKKHQEEENSENGPDFIDATQNSSATAGGQDESKKHDNTNVDEKKKSDFDGTVSTPVKPQVDADCVQNQNSTAESSINEDSNKNHSMNMPGKDDHKPCETLGVNKSSFAVDPTEQAGHGKVPCSKLTNGSYSIEKHDDLWCLRDLKTKKLYTLKKIKANKIEFKGDELLLVDSDFYQVITSSGKPSLEKCDDMDSDLSNDEEESQLRKPDPPDPISSLECQPCMSTGNKNVPTENQKINNGSQADQEGFSNTVPEQIHVAETVTEEEKGDDCISINNKCVLEMVQSIIFNDIFKDRFPTVTLDINTEAGKVFFRTDGDLEAKEKAKVWFSVESQTESVEFGSIRREVEDLPDGIETVLRMKYGPNQTVFWDINANQRRVNICACGVDKTSAVRAYLSKGVQVAKCEYSLRSETILQTLREKLSKKFKVCAIHHLENTLKIINCEPKERQSDIEKEADTILTHFCVKVLKILLKPKLCDSNKLVEIVAETGVTVRNLKPIGNKKFCLKWTFSSKKYARLEVNSEEKTDFRAEIIIDDKSKRSTANIELKENQALIHIPRKIDKKETIDQLLDKLLLTIKSEIKKGMKSICFCIPPDIGNHVLKSIWWATITIFADNQSPDMFVFNCMNTRSFSQCALIFVHDTPGHAWCEGHPLRKTALEEKDVLRVTIEQGCLDKTRADVLVYSVGKDLKLDQGNISKELLKSAGDELQDAVLEARSSINVGEFVATQSFKLQNCQKIFHAALEKYQNPNAFQIMKNLVMDCIEAADKEEMRSIAFPALGTGMVKFPPSIAAKAMFEAIEETQYGLNHILEIKLVIFDKETIKVFNDVKDKWHQPIDCTRRVSPVVTLDNISTRAICRPINEISCDILIVLTNQSGLANSRMENHKCTHTFKNKTWDSNLTNDLKTAISSTGSLADKQTVSIFVDSASILADNIGQKFMDFVKTMDKTGKSLRLELAFHDLGRTKTIFSSFPTEMDMVVALTVEGQFVKVIDVCGKDCNLRIPGVEIIEMSDEVPSPSASEVERNEEFDETLTKDIHSLTNQNQLKAPIQQSITRDVTFNLGSELETGVESNIVIVDGIKPHTTERDLKERLESLLVDNPSQLVFCEQRSDALLVFSDVKVAESMFGKKINGFTLKKHPKLALHHFVYYIRGKEYDQLKESGTLEFICCKRLMEPYFSISKNDTHGTLDVISQTRYGILYVKEIVSELVSKSYENISELKYDFLNAKFAADICGPVNIDGELSYVNCTIKLVCRRRDVAKHDTNITKLIGYEGEKEIPLGKDGVDKAADWCSEFEKECFPCAFVKEKSILVVLFEEYEDVKKVNLKLAKLRNESKTVSQSRHQVVNTNEASGNPASLTQSMKNISGLSFPNNKRIYKTLSGILVYVYQADICSLDVDCIVNAANSRLQHYGGVAAVIQRKAGDELRIEGDEYIRSHGEIKDGNVVTTRAGKLRYKYVLHAVGPRWSDYDTRTKRGEGDCRAALQNAVFNSFLKASELQLKSVALPAISSALFGVPMEICTEEYVQAVLMYSGVGADSSLREIHFVDILPVVITQIQTRFDEYVKKGDLSKADQFGTGSLRDGKTNLKPNQPSELGFHKGAKVTKISEQELKDQGPCVICMDDFTNPKKLGCGHIFCTDCINQCFAQKQVCPTCGKICGIIKGDQPPGTMTIKRESLEWCAGYQHVGRICITYSFNSGTQTENHPVPGKWYKGISRRGFLPDNKDGADVCRMLKVAFQRKLVFTIGSSRTTGEEGVITWNDIHHKTDHRPNTQFGYPDPSYLERVTDELKAKGVTHADIDPNDRLEDTVYCM